ncbi:MAG: FISUMP domain-containing protein, partial [Bacteroidales bacterium]|nr:FISUMP domain-containing protein [Bacteroidales bacterium]
GYYSIAVEVKDLDGLSAIARDSVTVFGKNKDISTLTDSRDGNQYRIVKIGGQWWMAENLRYGIVIPTDREQTDNDTVEMYRLSGSGQQDTIGGIYLWLEAKNYNVNDPKGICPAGWHLPTSQEWERLFTSYPRLYSIQYYGIDGLSNLNLDLNAGGIRINGVFERRYLDIGYDWDLGFWSSSFKMPERVYQPYFCSFNSKANNLNYGFWAIADAGLSRYYSIRCVKDN